MDPPPPPARRLPLAAGRRPLCDLRPPTGASCDSSYRRKWDEPNGARVQEGTHGLRLAPGLVWHYETRAWIEPGVGIRRLKLGTPDRRWEAELQQAPGGNP